MDIVILHGTKGSPDINWFPWLKREMESRGHTVYVPRLPTPEGQTKDNWCAALREQAPLFGKNTVLIGHSLGATLMLHVLEIVREPVAKSIFVSVVMDEIGNPEYDALNKSFLKTPDFDWLAISNNGGDINILHGDDDPYVSHEHSDFLQDQIGGELIIIPQGKHLNGEAGYTEFPLLLDLICMNEKTNA
jgi:hypothetical protein